MIGFPPIGNAETHVTIVENYGEFYVAVRQAGGQEKLRSFSVRERAETYADAQRTRLGLEAADETK